MSDLQHALEELYGLERRRDKLGLDGTRALLAALGNPERQFRAVHVAGTNGKGSTCALIERTLRAANIRSALFTSPHLVDFRERIRVEGRWADADRLAERLAHLSDLPEGKDRTFFEVCTALAFDDFSARRAEWAVVETGLGGRLDTTNVLTPEVSVITAIGLDHTEILGETLREVAGEKAGIIKARVPIVMAEQPAEADETIAAAATGLDAPLSRAGERADVREWRASADGLTLRARVEPFGELWLSTSLRGRHQLDNAVTALAALAVLAEGGAPITAAAVQEGFAAARWPGRLEPCPTEPRLWWDGAHNPEGAARLMRAWREDLGFEPPASIVFAASRDKDARAMLEPLHALAPDATLIVTRTRNVRAADPSALLAAAAALAWPAESADDVAGAVRRALDTRRGRILLAGSLFAVGEAMAALSAAPGECL